MSNQIYDQFVPITQQHHNKSEMQKIDIKEDVAVAEGGLSTNMNKLNISENESLTEDDISIDFNKNNKLSSTEDMHDKFFIPEENMDNIIIPKMAEFVSRCNSNALDPENLIRRHSSMVENLQQETQIDNSDENCVKPSAQYSNTNDQHHTLVNSKSSCNVYIMNNYAPIGTDTKILKKDVSNPDSPAYDYYKFGYNLIHEVALDKDVLRNSAIIADKFNFKRNREEYKDPYDYIYYNLASYCKENKITRHQLLTKLNDVVDISHLTKQRIKQVE